jgi:hypothetical protein
MFSGALYQVRATKGSFTAAAKFHQQNFTELNPQV